MIKISDNVANVLNKMYLHCVTTNNFSSYNKCISGLQSLKNDVPICGTVVAKDERLTFNWRREATLVIKVGNLYLSYEKSDKNNVVVHEVFDLQTMKLLEQKKYNLELVPLFEEFCSMI